MARYASYIRASTGTQETAHQRTAIDNWLSEHHIGLEDVDQFVDLGQSGAEPGREQFIDLVNAIQSENYDYVVV